VLLLFQTHPYNGAEQEKVTRNVPFDPEKMGLALFIASKANVAMRLDENRER
jgi:hypothetical protein